MQYEDRNPPEGINTPGRHPLREFLRLSAFAIIAVVLLGFTLNFVGASLGGLVPFKVELWLANKIDSASINAGHESPFSNEVTNTELQQYLQSVADRVINAMELEDSVQITLHYSDDDLVNAYATIGGHVYFFKGLLSLLPHENALAMLMAHEFSHVSLRHTAKGLGGSVTLVVGSALLGVSAMENRFFGLTTTLSSTRFSREMESGADRSALQVVNKLYGHVAGASALFELFMQQREKNLAGGFEKFLSTHPLDEQRIKQIELLAESEEYLLQGELTPLPEEFAGWLRDR